MMGLHSGYLNSLYIFQILPRSPEKALPEVDLFLLRCTASAHRENISSDSGQQPINGPFCTQAVEWLHDVSRICSKP